MGTGSKLDPNQITKIEHDDASGAKRVTMVNTEMSIELDADDGDSVQIQPRSYSNMVTLGQELDISAYKSLKMYAKSLSGGPHDDLKLHISPVASGDVWVDTGITLTPSINTGVSVASQAVSDVVALRAKITSSGSPDVTIYLVGKGA